MCIAMCMILYMAYVFMSISGNSRRIVRLFSPVLYLVLCIHLHTLILQEYHSHVMECCVYGVIVIVVM